jgi:hypothetical protein
MDPKTLAEEGDKGGADTETLGERKIGCKRESRHGTGNRKRGFWEIEKW